MPYSEIPSFYYCNFRKFGTQVIIYDQDQEPGNGTLDSFFNSDIHIPSLALALQLTLVTYTFPIRFATRTCLLPR